MSLKLPLQSKAIRPKFQNKKAIFGDADEDEDNVQDELVVGIENNKVKEAKPKEKKKVLSINPLPNEDWRKMAQHKKELYIPAQALQQEQQPQIEEEKVVQYGLQIQSKQEREQQDTIQSVQVTTEKEVTVVEEEKPKTLEERAVEAIIKDSMGHDNDEENNGPKRVIQVDETLAFRDDVKNRPDETTMEDYENIPVEEFGAALLRGLGWNEGEGIGRNRKAAPAPAAAPVKQREALLGLGARPEDVPKERKYEHKRAAYAFKDTSLFKKISKRRLNDDSDSDHSTKSHHHSSRDSSRESSSSSRRYDSGRDRESDRKHGSSSSRHSSSRHSSSRHNSSRHSSRDSRSSRYEDKRDRDSDRERNRDSDRERNRDDRYSYKSSSSSRKRSRSR